MHYRQNVKRTVNCAAVNCAVLQLHYCCNMVGDKEKLLVIGKAAKHRCFKGMDLRRLPVEWRSNRKAWMTTSIMTEWLSNFDKKIGKEKRKVILLLDNASSHPKIRLQNVQVFFLPPNTISVCQPLDQGVI